MFENHIKEVSFILASVILTLAGDQLVNILAIPFIKNFVRDFTGDKILRAVIGTILFLIYCSIIGLIFAYIFEKGIINKDNIDTIVYISFVVLLIYLEEKYRLSQSNA